MIAAGVDERVRSHLAHGDEAGARALLVEHFDRPLLAVCREIVRDPAVAEDMKQETFERAFAGLAGFRFESSVAGWLLRIARNRCIDHVRAKETRAVVAYDPHDLDPAIDATAEAAADDRQQVELALASVEDEDRELVLLHHVHGVSYGELADSLGLAEGTVRMRMSRALGRMREAIEHARRAEVAASNRRHRLRVMLAGVGLGLALFGATSYLYLGIIRPQQEQAAVLQAELQRLQEEERRAHEELQAAMARGASEDELRRLRDQVAAAQQAAATTLDPDGPVTSGTNSRSTVRRSTTGRTAPSGSGDGCRGPLCGLMR